ncbi:ADP-ribosylation factor-like protein 16 [Dendronephthya gigantea]|uniref:ADP-ribosylation factor-like protein 16 n=1 Tax=Dendronephthya gigantea TaxID=151771 RepID=UPI001069BF5D|nr:ADP-ribosylation factor-like protein 16 [Dendronephthya gigantea]
MDSQILVLGPEGGGKTMLLKRLQSYTSQMSSSGDTTLDEPPSTIPTVGVNLVSLQINKKKFCFRELGGAMAPVWSNYFKDSSHCIYVIDLANRGQIAASTILLLNLLTARQSSTWPVLIIFNKLDIPCGMTQMEISSIMRLQDIITRSSQKIFKVETCLHDGRGLSDVVNWLQETYRAK